MGEMTLRGVDDRMAKALKEKAKKDGNSVNATLIKILRESLGMEKKKRNIVYDDLDHLAGTWTNKDYREFSKKIADFEMVDKKMWK